MIWENMEGGDKHIIGIMSRLIETGDIVLTEGGDMNRGIQVMKGTGRKIEDLEGKTETVQDVMKDIALIDIVMKDLEEMIGMVIGKDKKMGREDKGEV